MLILAVDGGTTNTRAVLLRGREVVASAHVPVGARNTSTTGSNDHLRRSLAEAVSKVLCQARVSAADLGEIAASGMLTSNAGLVDLPHLEAPVSREQLARAVEARKFNDICDRPICFVRGIRTHAGSRGDMMRGEECETFGLLSLLQRRGPVVLVLPGSHTKIVIVDRKDRIVDLHTTLAGEMIDALSRHTILAGSVPQPLPTDFDESAVRVGADWARARGILQASFGVRMAQVLDGKDPIVRASLLAGIVLGSDVSWLVRAGVFEGEAPILVGGGEPMRSLYTDLLKNELASKGRLVEAVADGAARYAAAVGAAEIVSLARNLEVAI